MFNIFCVIFIIVAFKERHLVNIYFDSDFLSGRYKTVLCELVLINHINNSHL